MERATESAGGPSVLVVEDEPGVRLFVQAVLTRNGYAALLAGSAAEALRIAREHSGRIGLVICDVLLPDMNGQVLVKQLRDAWPDLPAVFISGYPRSDLGRLDLSEARFVEKPFRAQDLVAAMQRAIDVKAAPR